MLLYVHDFLFRDNLDRSFDLFLVSHASCDFPTQRHTSGIFAASILVNNWNGCTLYLLVRNWPHAIQGLKGGFQIGRKDNLYESAGSNVSVAVSVRLAIRVLSDNLQQ